MSAVSGDEDAGAGQRGIGAKGKRRSRSIYLPDDLIERAKAAVYWVRVAPGEPSSFAELAERGIRHEVERLEREFNDGEPMAIPEGERLRPGPAPGVMEKVAEMRRQARRPAPTEGDQAPREG